ncbi:hypothetical protein TNCT_343501, partial [Trichonephila clavata]
MRGSGQLFYSVFYNRHKALLTILIFYKTTGDEMGSLKAVSHPLLASFVLRFQSNVSQKRIYGVECSSVSSTSNIPLLSRVPESLSSASAVKAE